nr:MAG TPA: hypothetical protein [Caudoviricetes sp.]
MTCCLLPCGIVVERLFFAADCPYQLIVKPFRFSCLTGCPSN